jgi:hypothetical protein
MDSKLIESFAVVLGGIITWLLVNERRLARLEAAKERAAEDRKELVASIKSIHDRLDAYFLGKGPRTRPRNEEG